MNRTANAWPIVALGDLCEVNIGRTPSRNRSEFWGTGSAWLSIADMNQGRDLTTTKETITDVAVRDCNCRAATVGTVLLSFKLSVGKVGIARIPLYTNEAIAALSIRNPSRLLPEYLYWALRSVNLTTGLDRAAKGHTLNRDKLVRVRIPVPSVIEQRRITEVLDHAEALRAKRRAALNKLDRLTHAIFLDMFGDPITNPMKWPTRKLSDVGTIDRGVSKCRPRNAPELLGGPYPFVQTGDVANCDGYIRKFTATYSEAGLRQSKMWPAGTLCITIAANIAETGILTFDACFPDSVVGFRSADPATVEFVRHWLSFLQASLEQRAPESAQKNINLAILRALDIPVPAIELQHIFARRVAGVEALKAMHRASLAELEALFGSLQHRAFHGEL